MHARVAAASLVWLLASSSPPPVAAQAAAKAAIGHRASRTGADPGRRRLHQEDVDDAAPVGPRPAGGGEGPQAPPASGQPLARLHPGRAKTRRGSKPPCGRSSASRSWRRSRSARCPRTPASCEEHGLLYLPHPYVVPGGRFNEMYGWDSYFILLGLLRDDEVEAARDMVDNFVYEIEHYGTILNANRTYYLSRSQPPFLTRMMLGVFERTARPRVARVGLEGGREPLPLLDDRAPSRPGDGAVALLRFRRGARARGPERRARREGAHPLRPGPRVLPRRTRSPTTTRPASTTRRPTA